jgi:hypothetical protein
VKHHAHLLEERLFDCYLAQKAHESVDPRLAEHLADCEPCAARYADLAAFMDALQEDGRADDDALFTPERLRVQQQRIAERLRHLGQRARVISFPGRFVRRSMTPSGTHAAPRWVAAAAAAGLFVGVALGASYTYNARTPYYASASQNLARQSVAAPRLTPIATRGDGPGAVAADDAFLSDLEIALERPHTRELLAFDALTPHVREVSSVR